MNETINTNTEWTVYNSIGTLCDQKLRTYLSAHDSDYRDAWCHAVEIQRDRQT